MQGDRVSGARKPATLETGLVVQVPLFVNPGDRIKVDTRSGEYITRSVSLAAGAARRAGARPRPALRGRDQGLHGRRGARRPARRRRRVRRRRWCAASTSTSDRIDGLLGEHAKGWTLARMPALDRAALRMGTAELITRADVPTAVVLNETVELASRFSTDDSGRFVNGLLAKIATEVRPG